MIDLFKMRPVTVKPTHKFVKMEKLRSSILNNIAIMKAIYRKSSVVVNSRHILVRVIKSLTSSQLGNVERYMDIVYDNAYPVLHNLHVGTAIRPPSFNENERILPGIKYELLFATNDIIIDYPTKWTEIKPLTIKMHSESTFDFAIISKGLNDSGYAIIEINVGKLMYMYHQWRLWQRRINPDNQETTAMFVAKWVLPTLLDSYYDSAFFNLIMDYWNGDYEYPEARRIVSKLPEHRQHINSLVEDINGMMLSRSWEYSQLLANIPAITHDNMLSSFQLDSLPPTRNVQAYHWAITLQRLADLTAIDSANTQSRNTAHHREIERLLRRDKSEKWSSLLQKNESLILLDDITERISMYVT